MRERAPEPPWRRGVTFSGSSPADVADYVALTKPRLNLLVVVTSAAGFYLGGAPPNVGLRMARWRSAPRWSPVARRC